MSTTEESPWVRLPLEIAQKHQLYGIGGWLTLVILGCLASPIRIVASLGPVYAQLDFASLHPTLLAFIVVEIALNALVVLWSLGNLFLLFNKNPLFPTSYVAMLAFSAAFVTLDVVVVKSIMDSIGQPMAWNEAFDPETTREVGRAIMGAAIWIPYALVSRRVNVTYLNRVRPTDPLIKESTASVF